jgi:hypothetical protein
LEIRERLKELILSQLSEEQLAMILHEHKMLSQSLGFKVGIHAQGDLSIERKQTYTDEIAEGGASAAMVNTHYKDIIFSFLRVIHRILTLSFIV